MLYNSEIEQYKALVNLQKTININLSENKKKTNELIDFFFFVRKRQKYDHYDNGGDIGLRKKSSLMASFW